MEELEIIRNKAQELGLLFLQVAPAHISFPEEPLKQWLSKGYGADMQWLHKNLHIRHNPAAIVDFAQSIIVCGLGYYQEKPQRQGEIALYAQGRDYHSVLKKKMQVLVAYIEGLGEKARCFVDSAPLLERPIAEQAGAGWIGKSSLLVSPEHGTLFFLGEICTSLVLPYGTVIENKCGTCTACIDACPTQAIHNGMVDARACISYLTIEHMGSIPEQYRRAIGNRLYGCDECSISCVYNTFIATTEADFFPRTYPTVQEILTLTPEGFLRYFAGTALYRIGLPRLTRNACIVLGNTGTIEDIPLLERCIHQSDSLVREHAEWAIQEIIIRSKN